jgi:hypothetical protein
MSIGLCSLVTVFAAINRNEESRGPVLVSRANIPVACVYECRATHTAGVRSGRHRIGRSASPGKVIARRDLQPTAAVHDRENRWNLRSRLCAADVDPVLPTQSHGTHGILRKLIAQLKFRIFQKSCKFPPKRERVLASLAECAGRQCNGLRCLDLAPNLARGNTQRLAASFGVDGEQFLSPSGATILPEIRLVILSLALACLSA